MSVRRNPDNLSLYWITNGVRYDVNWQEEEAFDAATDTMTRQISARRTNNINLNNYTTAIANAQISENASRPYPFTVPPKLTVVDDPIMDDYGWVTAGIEHEVEWPNLPKVVKKGAF